MNPTRTAADNARPVVAIDVDGVLNPGRPPPHAASATAGTTTTAPTPPAGPSADW